VPSSRKRKVARIVAIIQARMGSARLPGKVLMEVDGRTMLSYLVERVARAKNLDDVIVATSTNPENDAIQKECLKLGVGCFRGDEFDVLNRYFEASQWTKADAVVRITSDDVLMDPDVVDYTVECYLSQDCDCATSYTTRSFPEGSVLSVFSQSSLNKVNRLPQTGYEREHVILAFLRYKDLFNVVEISAPSKWQAYHLSLALNTYRDYTLICEIIRELSKKNKHFGLGDVLTFLKSNPRLYELAHDEGY